MACRLAIRDHAGRRAGYATGRVPAWQPRPQPRRRLIRLTHRRPRKSAPEFASTIRIRTCPAGSSTICGRPFGEGAIEPEMHVHHRAADVVMEQVFAPGTGPPEQFDR